MICILNFTPLCMNRNESKRWSLNMSPKILIGFASSMRSLDLPIKNPGHNVSRTRLVTAMTRILGEYKTKTVS